MWTGQKIVLTQPHRLTDDETKFLRARSRKATFKSHHGEEKVLGYTRIKTATISKFDNLSNLSDLSNLGEFLDSDSFSGLTISNNNSLAVLADAL